MKRLAARASSCLVLLLASPLFAQATTTSQAAPPADWTEGLYWKIPFGIACGIIVGIIVYVVKKPKDTPK